jgi:putative nucleotidyltransferase with HDIG domain
MKRDTKVRHKIIAYNPKGGLAQTAMFFLALAEVNHRSTKDHVVNVSLLAESTAVQLKKDAKAAFFAGLLHDVGKLLLPANLFDGHNISPEEYTQIKEHARNGFKALMKLHMFTALCAGFHPNLYQTGYGVTMDDFPSKWSPATVKKVLDISTIVSICDFVDAFTNRQTKILDGSAEKAPDLKGMLYAKYPNDHQVVDAATNEIS